MRGEEMLGEVLERLPCGALCCCTEPSVRMLAVNSGVRELLGYTGEELGTLPGGLVERVVHPGDWASVRRCLMEADERPREMECRMLHKDGGERYVLLGIRAVPGADEGRAIYCTFMDMTRRRQQEEEAHRAAEHRERKLSEQARRDALTDLYNQKAARAEAELLMEAWEPGTLQALMIIDLDDFKHINDSYGHMCGDEVLTNLAACLKRLLRPTDSVGRVGGDEFLAYLPHLPDHLAAEKTAAAILEALARIPLREGCRQGVSCSIGIAFYPEQGTDYAKLYRRADLALYQAKGRGKRGYAVYGDTL